MPSWKALEQWLKAPQTRGMDVGYKRKQSVREKTGSWTGKEAEDMFLPDAEVS